MCTPRQSAGSYPLLSHSAAWSLSLFLCASCVLLLGISHINIWLMHYVAPYLVPYVLHSATPLRSCPLPSRISMPLCVILRRRWQRHCARSEPASSRSWSTQGSRSPQLLPPPSPPPTPSPWPWRAPGRGPRVEGMLPRPLLLLLPHPRRPSTDRHRCNRCSRCYCWHHPCNPWAVSGYVWEGSYP